MAISLAQVWAWPDCKPTLGFCEFHDSQFLAWLLASLSTGTHACLQGIHQPTARHDVCCVFQVSASEVVCVCLHLVCSFGYCARERLGTHQYRVYISVIGGKVPMLQRSLLGLLFIMLLVVTRRNSLYDLWMWHFPEVGGCKVRVMDWPFQS